MIFIVATMQKLLIKRKDKKMKNKKQESFNINFYNEESFSIDNEEEGIDEKILSLDELLDQDVMDGVDDIINNLIEEIFG